MPGGALRLGSSERVEGHVKLALEAALGVVSRLAVRQQDQPQQALGPVVRHSASRALDRRAASGRAPAHGAAGAQRWPRLAWAAAAVTVSGNAICGQSFHSRSRE